MRADYCPMAGEPCQSMCDQPCSAHRLKLQADVVAKAWEEGYRAGINDERMSEANIGIAGFNAKIEPARNNPYRSKSPPAEPTQSAMRVVGQCPETNEQCQSNCDTPCTVKPVPLLSDEEIEQADDSMCGEREFSKEFARAIEQLVRRKAGL